MRTFVLIIFTACIGFAQSQEFPLNEEEMDSLRVFEERSFGGSSLWGHINGGADLYLEYGFDVLLFQEVKYKGIDCRVEVYRMETPEAALGIFSISKYGCSPFGSLPYYNCVSDYHVQTVCGRNYVSISNQTGSPEAVDACMKLAKTITETYNGCTFPIPEPLRKDIFKPYYFDMKYINGRLGLENGAPGLIDLFDEIENFEIYILYINNKGAQAELILVNLENKAETEQLYGEIMLLPRTVFSKEITEDSLIFMLSEKENDYLKKIIDELR